MSVSQFAVPEGHAFAGVRAVKRKYNAGGYDGLIRASVDSFNRTQKLDTLFTPGVRFIVDAALAGLEHFDQADLGARRHEVHTRAELASSYAKAMNAFATSERQSHRGFFNRLYLGSPALNAAMTEAYEHGLGDLESTLELQPDYLGSQGSSVFREVSPAAGGAVKFLKEQNPEMDGKTIRNIVIASDDLRHIGNVPKDWVKAIHDDLETPYIDTHHYASKGPDAVTFTPETRAHLRELRATEEGSGCPANNIMYTAGETKVNAMREGWHDAASFLVTAQATTDLRYRDA